MQLPNLFPHVAHIYAHSEGTVTHHPANFILQSTTYMQKVNKEELDSFLEKVEKEQAKKRP